MTMHRFLLLLFLLLPALPSRAEDLTLHAAVVRALADNPAMAAARLGVAAGEEGVKSAFGRHLPRLALDGNYTIRQDPLPYIPAQSATIGPHFSDQFASYTITLTLPLYQGGQIVNGVALSQARKVLQEQGAVLTRNELIANTVNTYNKILQLASLRDASQASLTALEQQQANAQLLFKVGRIARVDLLKVEVQTANEQQRLTSLNAGIATAFATLRTLMGTPEQAVQATAALVDHLGIPSLQADFGAGLVQALKQRPEYQSALQEVRVADLNRKMAMGKLLPGLAAFGGYLDQFGLQPWYKEANWFGGVNLNMPLFDRSLYADLSRQRIEADRAREQLHGLENQVRLELRSALNSLDESRARIGATRQAVEQAHEAYRIEQQRFQTGAGAVVDLLLAQSADVTAAANYSQALYDYNAAVVAYRRATGTLEEYLQ